MLGSCFPVKGMSYKRMLYAVRCLKSNEDMILALAGQFKRQIRTICRILDVMFAELGSAELTYELLVTLMAEVTAIVNARPIALVPTDIDEPQPL